MNVFLDFDDRNPLPHVEEVLGYMPDVLRLTTQTLNGSWLLARQQSWPDAKF